MSRLTGRRRGQPQAPPETDPASRQVRADRDITGIASSGDQAVNIQNRAQQITVLPAEAFAPLTEVDVPPGLTNLPERPGLFVGRAAELARLDRALAGPGGVVVQAVHGLGGIGKSTLATHWAANNAARHTLTWWITADSPAGIDAGLANLARGLQPALANILPAEALRDRAMQWLASHQGWLMVLDNVSNPADITPLLAQPPTGRYLITSRRSTGWHNLAKTVSLDVLNPAEALDLLTQVLVPAGPRDLDGAAELCAELGFLPLAVEQAGAYIAQAGITPQQYLDLLADYPAKIYRATAEGGDAERTIARIWHVTLDRLSDEPLTGQVLRILAWYSPDAIPRSLLDGLADPPALISAIGRLGAYSMLTAAPEAVTVHRLVQAVARTPEPGDRHRDHQAIATAREQATAQLDAAIPDNDPAHWPVWRTLLPHISALASHASTLTDTETTASLLHEVGIFVLGQGQVARATEYLQRALTDLTRILGNDHPDTLDARNSLASAYLEAGDLSQAITMFDQILAHKEQVLGGDHPETLTFRSNLAYAHSRAGHLDRAIPMLKQSLADRQRVLGNDHPDVLTSRNNLARAYQDAKDLSQAIPLFEQNLAEADRILGSDHPRTLTSRVNLASAYTEKGETSLAIPLLKQILTDQERILGSDHPGTMDCRNELARAYKQARDLDRAIPIFEKTLTDRQRVLGNDHPDVLTSRNNLACAYQDAKNLSQAIPLFEQNLAEADRILGSDHPRALVCRSGLGGACLEAGDLDRAILLFEQNIADRQRILGSDHPDTLASRYDLAHAKLEAGDLDQAIRLYRRSVADQQRILGNEHPDTLTSRHGLATAYLEAGHLDQAIALFEQCCTEIERVLGGDHPYNLASRSNLARAYLLARDPDHAFPLLGQTLLDFQRILGRDHPDTLTVRSNLAVAYWQAGDLTRAIALLEQILADRQRILGSDHPDTLASRRSLATARAASN
jgi:tetratricopeptide (TPR) repeat protein